MKFIEDKKGYYLNKIFNILKRANMDDLFTNEELKNLAFNLFLNYQTKYYEAPRKSTIYAYVASCVQNLMFTINDQDRLITYYVIYLGKTNKILSYLLEKYNYINEKYINNYSLYENIINKVLSLPNLSHIKIENKIKNEALKGHNQTKNKKLNIKLDSIKNNPNAKNILLENYSFYIDKYKKEYKFYDSEEKVNLNLNSIFEKTVDSYLNGESKKLASTYLSTFLSQRFENYQNKTIKEKYFANIILIVNDYLNVLELLYKNNNLTPSQKGNLEEYMNLILEEYIENGNYKDNKRHFINMINNYNDIQKRYSYEKRKNG